MAAAAGKKESASLSLSMEVNSLEVEEEISTMATLAWAEGERGADQGVATADLFEVQTWRQMTGLAGAVMSETRDFGTPCCLN